jgi:hypothetical protein
MRVAVPRPDVELPCAIFALVSTKFIPRPLEPLVPLADDPLEVPPLPVVPAVPVVAEVPAAPELPAAPEVPARPVADIVSC